MAVTAGAARPNLRLTHFGGVWAASAASNLADGLLLVSLPIVALRLSASPGLVAAVAAVAGLPWLLAPLAGVVADRYDRRILTAAVHAARAAFLLGIAALILADLLSIGVLLVLALLLGVLETVADSATETLVPTVVESAALEAANTRLRVTMTVTNLFIGPGLAGLLLAGSGATPFLVAGTAYVVAAVLVSGLSGRFAPDRSGGGTSIRADLAQGVRWLRAQSLLLRLAVMLSVIVAGQSMVTSVLVVYAVSPGPMGLDEIGFSLLRFAVGAGGVLAGLVVTRLISRLGRAVLLRCCVAGGVLMFATPALTASPVLVAGGLFVGGMAEMVWVVIVRSLAQALTPNELLGRVGSLYTLLAWGSIPVGSALGGVLGELAGVRTVFAVAAAAAALAGLVVMRPVTTARIEAARGSVGMAT